ncbi:MAG: hypothetical protein ACREAC_30935, partial [Blastocatellia bacterium]
IRAYPHESVRLFSKVGLLWFTFALALYILTRSMIVNPILSVCGLMGCTLFWIMAAVDEHRTRK